MTGESPYPPGPWQADVDKAFVGGLNDIWAKWTAPSGLRNAIEWYESDHDLNLSPDEVKAVLGDALKARKAELLGDDDQAPDPRRTESTRERVDNAIVQHLAATDAYAVVVEEQARLDAEAKRLAARKYLEVKADVPEGQKRVTDTEANRAVDADETVLEARLAADIALAQTRAAKARLDHWEHVIEWGRSVFSRETKADTR